MKAEVGQYNIGNEIVDLVWRRIEHYPLVKSIQRRLHEAKEFLDQRSDELTDANLAVASFSASYTFGSSMAPAVIEGNFAKLAICAAGANAFGLAGLVFIYRGYQAHQNRLGN